MPIVHLMLMLLKQEHKRIVHKNIPRKNEKYRAICLLIIRARDWQKLTGSFMAGGRHGCLSRYLVWNNEVNMNMICLVWQKIPWDRE